MLWSSAPRTESRGGTSSATVGNSKASTSSPSTPAASWRRQSIHVEGSARVGDHKTSMLQDLEAGRPMEIDALTGSVVELGDRLGVPVPHLRTLYSSVKFLQATSIG